MDGPDRRARVRRWGLASGATFLLATLALPAPAGMTPEAWRVAGMALLMAAWWITEALPIPATALLPLVAFPLLGIAPIREAAAPYADPIIFLFLGGFIIGAGVQRAGLHRRIGLSAVRRIGLTPPRLVGGFLCATALLSMWVSNSAAAIMMLPVALSVLALCDKEGADQESRRNLGITLMLAVAYGASIGGLGTLIGTPPNALLAAYLSREHGVAIGFAQWMALALPVVALMLLGAWLILTRLYPARLGASTGSEEMIAATLAGLGPLTRAERRVAIVFVLTALAWVTRPLYGAHLPAVDDAVIAITGALALFLLPSGMADKTRLLTWDDLTALPWGVLVLFGGGLSLAAAIGSSGLAAYLGGLVAALSHAPALVIVAGATLAMIFLTELTSNTASAATFLPIGGAVALGIGLDPVLITVPLALAASCAFMLPVATPPNAIVFASGRLTVAQMAWAGLWINLLAGAVLVAVSYPLAGLLFGR